MYPHNIQWQLLLQKLDLIYLLLPISRNAFNRVRMVIEALRHERFSNLSTFQKVRFKLFCINATFEFII